MPEGDTIHRAARRLNAVLGGHELDLAEAPSARSPIHNRADELRGRTLEGAEARGKHLLVEFSGGLVLHSHLGVGGRLSIRADGRRPGGRPWVLLAAGPRVAAQYRGQLLRLVSSSRARNDPSLMQLGPDPLAAGFDRAAAAGRLLEVGRGRELGDALLDQTIIAGIGNAIRTEACFRARISPWRAVAQLDADEAERVIGANQWVMEASLEHGRRPRSIYRRSGRPCPRCGAAIRSRGQGDANRIAYWCPSCQR